MIWQRFFPDQQIPIQIEGLLRSGVLRDKTTDHDTCVRFEGKLEDGDTLVLWIENPNPAMRSSGAPRYALELWEDDKLPRTLMESDKTETILLMTQEMLSERGGPRLV